MVAVDDCAGASRFDALRTVVGLSLVATCLLAGSICAIASGGDAALVNPKAAQQRYFAPPSAVSAPQRPVSTPSPGTLAINGSDNCATPDAISGIGTFAFDNSLATTGSEGQTESLCLGFGSTAIVQDVWFAWTAPATGTASMTTCGGTIDTKIAAYAGSGCPAPGTALACNDDSGCPNFASTISFPVSAGSVYTLQVGLFPFGAMPGAGSFTLGVAVPISNDDCSSPTVVAGSGPHPFTNVGATTGPQQGVGCGLGTCYADVWFQWVATVSGQCQFSLCNGSVNFDSVIAVYSGGNCPSPGTAIDCNNDYCGFASKCTFSAVLGNTYMLQIGAWTAGLSGSGMFELTPTLPPPPCTPYDDGITDNLGGWAAGGDYVWMSRFGNPGYSTTIQSIDVMWGSALFPGYGGGNGQATNVFVWQDDASQDGLPGTSTLLVNIPTTVSAIDTDTYVNYPVTPLTITGYFYVGSRASHLPGQFVGPLDLYPPLPLGVTWFFGVNVPGQFANYANPGANVQPPAQWPSGLSHWCVRVRCVTSPVMYICDPGAGPTQACPCANPPSGSGRGCDNSSSTGGASISATGTASLGSSALVFTTAGERPTALSIVLQGTTVDSGGIVFGQGVRCVGGILKRLYTHNAVGGGISAPSGADLPVPARSASLGDHIFSGQSRWYCVYYRDATILGGCSTSATFNVTNTAEVVWAP